MPNSHVLKTEFVMGLAGVLSGLFIIYETLAVILNPTLECFSCPISGCPPCTYYIPPYSYMILGIGIPVVLVGTLISVVTALGGIFIIRK